MAISPKEAATMTHEERAQVENLELAIDRRLRERGSGTTLTTRGLSARVVAELRIRYQAVGWRVERVCDQREGDYLEFLAPPTIPRRAGK